MSVYNPSPLMNLPDLNQIWQTLAWQPNEHQQQQFQQLYQAILAGNSQFNLTRIVAPDDFWEKHLWDSVAGVMDYQLAPAAFKAIDIGTGAGFPGVPLAIAYPDWHVTLLDSTGKKIRFLQSLLTQLDLKATALNSRAEAVGQHPDHRESYDIAVVRAVGAAVVCAEYALPLLQIGGLAVLYRGRWSEEEQLALQYAVEQLGAEIEGIRSLTTPLSQSIRHCVYLRKRSSTPSQFPRAVGVPPQQPLTINF
ncbi:MAG: 16S rRNA (guanine(527)-N(7))-methyltransferase RsmG [Cyanophyceae cyanobacterium]